MSVSVTNTAKKYFEVPPEQMNQGAVRRHPATMADDEEDATTVRTKNNKPFLQRYKWPLIIGIGGVCLYFGYKWFKNRKKAVPAPVYAPPQPQIQQNVPSPNVQVPVQPQATPGSV